jgi:hypothetical protein
MIKVNTFIKKHNKTLEYMQLKDNKKYMTVIDEHKNYYIIEKQAYIKRIKLEVRNENKTPTI